MVSSLSSGGGCEGSSPRVRSLYILRMTKKHNIYIHTLFVRVNTFTSFMKHLNALNRICIYICVGGINYGYIKTRMDWCSYYWIRYIIFIWGNISECSRNFWVAWCRVYDRLFYRVYGAELIIAYYFDLHYRTFTHCH